MPFLGAHMSVAGGAHLAIDRAKQVDCEALQIFTKNSNQWNAKPISEKEAAEFQEKKKSSGLKYTFSHDSYLINLGSPDPVLWEKSLNAFIDEIDRAEKLHLDFIVFHPGAHVGDGVENGCKRVSQGMNRALEAKPNFKGKLLLENAAGQGTTLGRTFEELAMIWKGVEDKSRAGFCFDTCHAFAAGYNLKTKEGYEQVMKEFEDKIGCAKIQVFHLNDSKKGLDCRVDRHMHIGQGELGLEAFRCLLNDKRFADRPMVLETPKSDDLHEDVENLSILRKLIA